MGNKELEEIKKIDLDFKKAIGYTDDIYIKSFYKAKELAFKDADKKTLKIYIKNLTAYVKFKHDDIMKYRQGYAKGVNQTTMMMLKESLLQESMDWALIPKSEDEVMEIESIRLQPEYGNFTRSGFQFVFYYLDKNFGEHPKFLKLKKKVFNYLIDYSTNLVLFEAFNAENNLTKSNIAVQRLVIKESSQFRKMIEDDLSLRYGIKKKLIF